MDVLHGNDSSMTRVEAIFYTDERNGGYSGFFIDILDRLRERHDIVLRLSQGVLCQLGLSCQQTSLIDDNQAMALFHSAAPVM